MNTCKTCKHWAGKVAGLQMPYTDKKGHPWMEMYGRCEHETASATMVTVGLETPAFEWQKQSKWLSGITVKDFAAVRLGEAYPTIYTGPDHGCIHHEPK